MSEEDRLLTASSAEESPIGRLIRFFLENKLVVGLLLLGVVVGGLAVAPFDWELGDLPRSPVPTDAIPDIGENQQIVFTRWMGRSPQDVEEQVTYPLTVSLLGIPKVRTIRSYSFLGFSTIYIIFRDRVDFYWSRSRVLEKLASLPVGTLPEGVQPMLGSDATALGQVFWYTLEGRDPEGNPTGGWELQELRTRQDWYVRYALMSAEGIAEVASVGGFVQEYQIDVDPDAMRAHGVTLEEVFRAVRMSNVDVGARTIEVNRVEYVIRGLGFIKSVRTSPRYRGDRWAAAGPSTRGAPKRWAAWWWCATASIRSRPSRTSSRESRRLPPDCRPRRWWTTAGYPRARWRTLPFARASRRLPARG
jgi:Cu(I)/Ag(I) efflux system membrane protein CusA/SilA